MMPIVTAAVWLVVALAAIVVTVSTWRAYAPLAADLRADHPSPRARVLPFHPRRKDYCR